MVAGWNTDISYTCGGYGFRFPTDSGNTAHGGRLILSVHCYDPWEYCGEVEKEIYLWGENGKEIVEFDNEDPVYKAEWGEEEHIKSRFTMLKEMYVDKGIPVVIGEFGCIDKRTFNSAISERITENRVYYNGFVAGTAASCGITPVYWDNGYNGDFGFGLFNRRTLERTQPEIIDAIVNGVKNKDPMAGCDKVRERSAK